MTPPSPPVPDGGALCLRCGLCCTGELFEDVRLDPAELPVAQRLRLPLVAEPSQLAFSAPCPQHADAACAAYDERPRACREFVCHTLAAYLAGELDRAAADERIDRLRRLVSRIRAALPEETSTLGLWAAVRRFSEAQERAEGASSWRARHAALLLDLFELERQKRREFTGEGRGA